MKATVNADLLNVRSQPNTQSAVIGMLTMNQIVDVAAVQDGWAALKLEAGGADITINNEPGIVYVSAEFLSLEAAPSNEPDPGTPVTPSATPYKLGLNAMQNTHLAAQEAERGCEFFLIMNDYGGAANLKRTHPNATVMVRRFIEHRGLITVDQMIQFMEGAEHKDLVYVGLNENDQLTDRGDDLRKRAQFDLEVARRIKEKSGAVYAAGTFSMGCPDFTNPETCQIIRELYAPAYNSGLIAFDMHLYTPNPQNIDKPEEWKWFERRWEFLFTRCGFDPKIRGIYSSECGLDEMGVGGFRAHNYTVEQVRDWCQKYVKLQHIPLIVDGVKFVSPIIGGAIFQLGGNGDPRWGGYEMNTYLPAVRDVYSGQTADRSAPKGVAKRVAPKAAKPKMAKVSTKAQAAPAKPSKPIAKPLAKPAAKPAASKKARTKAK